MTEKKTEKDHRNIYERLHAVMQSVSYVQKDPKKEGLQYRAVSHDAVTAKVRPALVENGVIYFPQNLEISQDGNRTRARFDVRFLSVANPSDFIDIPTIGYGVDNQDKGPGKAISYGVKYALLKALGLETGDDPDNESIDHEPSKKPEHVSDGEMQFTIQEIKDAKNLDDLEIAKDKARAIYPRCNKAQKTAITNAINEMEAKHWQAPPAGEAA